MLVELNDADAQGNSIDERIELAGTYAFNSLSVHAGYVNSPAHEGLLGLAASYRYSKFNFVGVYQNIEQAKGVDDTLINFAVDADLTQLNRVCLAVTTKQDGASADLDQVHILLGGEHRFNEHFLAFVEFFSKSTDVAQAGDEAALASGFRFDF